MLGVPEHPVPVPVQQVDQHGIEVYIRMDC